MKYSTYFDWLSSLVEAGFFMLYASDAPMPIYIFWAVVVIDMRLKSIHNHQIGK